MSCDDCAQTLVNYNAMERRWREARAREHGLLVALVAAALPLEVLAGQIREKPYRELTDELQAEIESAVLTVRRAVSAARAEPA